ncbi:MAG: DUF2459 domain-containing protein [Spirochaetales bacterium]|nr:DUF2459 domain-containing protein [Spirochaetales bacterium]
MNLLQNFKKGSGVLNWRKLILFPLLVIIFVFIYGLMTLLGATIPVNLNRNVPVEGERIYLVNNGYHIALALPRDSCPYGDIFDVPFNLSGKGGFFYFGWGDRQFYLGTPTVRNIDFSMAIKALFSPSSAVLEVLYLHSLSSDRPGVSSFLVTEDELSDLYEYIKKYIIDPYGLPEQISSDNIDQAFQGSIFFEASGVYSLFNTCNNWTSRGLRKSGINTHLWTPFTWGVE